MEYKFDAIITGKSDIGETDRLYTVFTREKGRLRLLGKGVRKSSARLSGNLETLTRTEIFVAKSRGRGNITGAIAVEYFENLKRSIEASELCFWALRFFHRLVTQEEKDEPVFSLLKDYLKSMDRAAMEERDGSSLDMLTLGFVFKLFWGLGYSLELGKCLCGRTLCPGKNSFSSLRGGIICPECSLKETKKIPLENESVKLLRVFFTNKIESLFRIKAGPKTIANLKIVALDWADWLSG